jgi:hypothetical protein
MSNKIDNAIARSASAASHLVHTGSEFEFQKAGKLNLKKSQNHVEHRACKFNVINPSAQPSSALASGSSVFTDYRMTASEPLNGITIVNTLMCDPSFVGTPGPITSSNVWDTIDRVQILLENGSIVLTEISGAAMEAYHFSLNKTQWRAINNGMSGCNTNQQAASLDAGESTEIYIPLFFDPLSSNEIAISALSSPVTVRIYWRSGTYLNVTQELDITSTSLMLNQYQYDKSVRSKMFSKLMSPTPVHFRYPRQGKQELSASITPGTPFEFRLSGVHGLISELTLQVEIAGVTTEIDSFDLLDESGQTMLGTRLKTRFVLASQRPKHDVYIQAGKSAKYVKIPISDSNTEAHSGHGQLIERLYCLKWQQHAKLYLCSSYWQH